MRTDDANEGQRTTHEGFDVVRVPPVPPHPTTFYNVDVTWLAMPWVGANTRHGSGPLPPVHSMVPSPVSFKCFLSPWFCDWKWTVLPSICKGPLTRRAVRTGSLSSEATVASRHCTRTTR